MKTFRTLRAILTIICLLAVSWTGTEVRAHFKKNSANDAPVGGCTRGEPAKMYWECGLIIQARRGGCKNIIATVPCPVDWPEQNVKVVEERFSPYARVNFQKYPGGSTLMNISIPTLPAGEKAEVIAKFEVENYSQLAPEIRPSFPARAGNSSRPRISR